MALFQNDTARTPLLDATTSAARDDCRDAAARAGAVREASVGARRMARDACILLMAAMELCSLGERLIRVSDRANSERVRH